MTITDDAPPVANAGQDQTIQLPTDSVTLDGTRSTDDVRIITYRWKQTEGPTRGVRLSGERTARLGVAGLSAGEYTFSLEVSDGEEQLDYDQVKVTVQPGRHMLIYENTLFIRLKFDKST